MIRAIETPYDGYVFRSTLEARWALFFNELGIEYRYELQGYEMPASRYLPDFYLPLTGVHFEVKPFRLSWKERQKAKDLCRYKKQTVIAVEGDPLFPFAHAWVYVLEKDRNKLLRYVCDDKREDFKKHQPRGGNYIITNDGYFQYIPHKNLTWVLYNISGMQFWQGEPLEWAHRNWNGILNIDQYCTYDEERVKRAMLRARQHRFDRKRS